MKFYVRENGHIFGTNEMSGQEWAAIEECVTNLVMEMDPSSAYSQDRTWAEAEMPDYDDAVSYGLLNFYTINPAPKNNSEAESRTPAQIPAGILATLVGKTFPISPPQYGLSPWGEKVEIVFE
jgi:hypothetical protein